jgi:hypothetical protein
MPRKSPHLLLPPRCLSRAMSRHFIKVSLSIGLLGKQIAPAFSARVRTASSEKAVMKMMRTWCPCASKRAGSWTPLMAGIWTSVITHDVSLKCADRKNSPADANVCTLAIPADLQSIRSTSRHNAGHAHFCWLIFGVCFAGKALAWLRTMEPYRCHSIAKITPAYSKVLPKSGGRCRGL